MRRIFLLTNYKNFFGSKQKSSPYKSGMDKPLIKKLFGSNGYSAEFISFTDIDFKREKFKDQLVLYTSSEDKGYFYKDYIEDVVYGLKITNAKLMPDFKFLRANNNKVFMEILRYAFNFPPIENIRSLHCGTYEDLKNKKGLLEDKMVIKTAKGAMSTGVFLSKSEKDLMRQVKKISRTKYLFSELWDMKNRIKHKGFIKDSKYRRKFIVQNFISGLKNDWKILVYGKRYYVLYRETRKNDFRASGSGKFKYITEMPNGLLEFARQVFQKFNVPNLSMDVIYDGNNFYLLEFQALYFGTKTLENSDFYYIKHGSGWELVRERSNLEKVYVDSIVEFIVKNNL